MTIKTIGKEFEAYIWGLLGVMGFSLTLPATKLALPLFGVVGVGIGRAVIAGVLSLCLLAATKSKLPTRHQTLRLILVAAGVVFGFPLFSAYGMKYLPASHGAIVIGLLPLATALFAVILAKEKPSLGFWLAGAIGSSTIVFYSLIVGGGTIHLADLSLLMSVLSASVGYAEGTRLAKEMGSWRVICYALVLSLPIAIALFSLLSDRPSDYSSLSAWLGFLYLSFFSMFLAFFAWYRGLEMGGIAKIGQLQLLQPFMTIFASSFLFSEKLSPEMFLVLSIVLGSVYFGRRAKVIRN
ncbi:DMT family transporter [Tumidithrix elongata RA019]|uniref:DMT family transporter n=1 Tax=Tumidithrix elongata BACA0141 TaxID=2716417 RepID=A0AAW9Q2W8_9CYAN|nr:DMT family transporter [Tumidithrix elongata RA019]